MAAASVTISARETYRKACEELSCRRNSHVELLLPGPDDDPTRVATVDLSQNLVGPLGFRALLPALVELPHLAVLNAANNQIDNDCAIAMLTALAPHKSLHTVDLSGNPISHAGGKHLLRMASRSNTLTTLILQGTLINLALQRRITDVLFTRSASRDTDYAASSKSADGAIAAQPPVHPAPQADEAETAPEEHGSPLAPAHPAHTVDEVDVADEKQAAQPDDAATDAVRQDTAVSEEKESDRSTDGSKKTKTRKQNVRPWYALAAVTELVEDPAAPFAVISRVSAKRAETRRRRRARDQAREERGDGYDGPSQPHRQHQRTDEDYEDYDDDENYEE
jgi:cell division septation protein DedD